MLPTTHASETSIEAIQVVTEDVTCCVGNGAEGFVLLEEENQELPEGCCPFNGHSEDLPCACTCCTHVVPSVPVMLSIDSESIKFFDCPHLLLINTDTRIEYVSLGVDIQPPIV